MAILPSKFLSLRECSFDSLDETYLNNPKSYNRASAKKVFSQLFDLDLVTTRFDMATAFELVSWLIDNASGTHGTFHVENPFHSLLLPYETNAISTRSAISQHAKSVPVDGLSPMLLGALKPGSFFNFGDHPKAYMVTNSPNANALGQSTISFTPGVYQDVPADTPINYGANCLFQVSSKADVQSLTASVSSNLRASITIPVRERGN